MQSPHSHGDALLWKRFLHPLWDAVGECGPILRWLWRTTQLDGVAHMRKYHPYLDIERVEFVTRIEIVSVSPLNSIVL
jgi:hypothetical protein